MGGKRNQLNDKKEHHLPYCIQKDFHLISSVATWPIDSAMQPHKKKTDIFDVIKIHIRRLFPPFLTVAPELVNLAVPQYRTLSTGSNHILWWLGPVRLWGCCETLSSSESRSHPVTTLVTALYSATDSNWVGLFRRASLCSLIATENAAKINLKLTSKVKQSEVWTCWTDWLCTSHSTGPDGIMQCKWEAAPGRGPCLPLTTMVRIISQLWGWLELRSFPFMSTGTHFLPWTLAQLVTSCRSFARGWSWSSSYCLTLQPGRRLLSVLVTDLLRLGAATCNEI